MESHQQLDARGLDCPLPILRTKKAPGALAYRQALKVISTGPGSVKHRQPCAWPTGHELLSSAAAAGEFVFNQTRHWPRPWK